MKKHFIILNSIMSVIILFSILFQSLHNVEHLIKKITETKCEHQYRSDKEITHPHNNIDKCFVCEFAFSSCIGSHLESFTLFNSSKIFKKDSTFLKQSICYFIGISYSLRGPPRI
jgi:hypothetical protein